MQGLFRQRMPQNAAWLLQGVAVDRTQRLGRGSYGTVHVATWQGTHVAAKQLHEIFFEEDDAEEGQMQLVSDFATECARHCELQHPNIAQFFGVYFATDNLRASPLMICELMEETLHERIRRRPRLSVESAIDIAVQISLALRYLHVRTEPIGHRDLSSNNVMRSRSGEYKIVDLGLAKVFSAVANARHTMKPGTLPYMPGEVLWDPPVYNEKLDVFCLGVILLESLLGRGPNPMHEFTEERVIDGEVVRVLIPETRRRQAELDELNEHAACHMRQLIEDIFRKQEERPDITTVHDALVQLPTRQNSGLVRRAATLPLGASADADPRPHHAQQVQARVQREQPRPTPRRTRSHPGAAATAAASAASQPQLPLSQVSSQVDTERATEKSAQTHIAGTCMH